MSNNQGNQLNEQELIVFIAGETNVDAKSIELVLKLEQKFIDNAQEDAKGEVEIDSDELVDYILKQQNVKLDEMTVEKFWKRKWIICWTRALSDISINSEAGNNKYALTNTQATKAQGPSSTRNREPLFMSS